MASVLCVICYGERNEWSVLACGHVFHEACLAEWLRQNPVCPQCQRGVAQNAPKRIYFATEEDREVPATRRQEEAASPAGAVAEDPQEVDQLRQMVFMEAQEKDAAWKEVLDKEKIIARLRSEESDNRREAQRAAQEFENCQIAMIQRDADHEQALRRLEQQHRETEETLQQMQWANNRLEEAKEQLRLQLRSAEQRNRELMQRLDTEVTAAVSVAEQAQSRQADLEKQLAHLTSMLDGCKRQLEMEQRERQKEREQKGSWLAEKSQLTERLNYVQASYSSLRSVANEEVNKYKALSSESQIKAQELQTRVLSLQLELQKEQREKEALTELLLTKDQKIDELKRQTSSKHFGSQATELSLINAEINAGEKAYAEDGAFLAPKEEVVSGAASFGADNFADFPVFDPFGGNEDVGGGKSRLQQSKRVIGQSTLNLVAAWKKPDVAEDDAALTRPAARVEATNSAMSRSLSASYDYETVDELEDRSLGHMPADNKKRGRKGSKGDRIRAKEGKSKSGSKCRQM